MELPSIKMGTIVNRVGQNEEFNFEMFSRHPSGE